MHGIVFRLKTYPYLFIVCVFLSRYCSVFVVIVVLYSFLFLLICLHWWRLRPLRNSLNTRQNAHTTAWQWQQYPANNLNSNVFSTRFHKKICIFFFPLCMYYTVISWNFFYTLDFVAALLMHLTIWLIG